MYKRQALGRSKKVQEFFKENDVPFLHFDLSDDESFNQLPTENIEAVIDYQLAWLSMRLQ